MKSLRGAPTSLPHLQRVGGLWYVTGFRKSTELFKLMDWIKERES